MILPETQPVVTRSPADPASPESHETTVTQAGGVWYPDSAFKTAQVPVPLQPQPYMQPCVQLPEQPRMRHWDHRKFHPDQHRVIVCGGRAGLCCVVRLALQSIRDFNGEGLPLFIFANWRGFSGGQRDMFDQVLKFGAYIVEGECQHTCTRLSMLVLLSATTTTTSPNEEYASLRHMCGMIEQWLPCTLRCIPLPPQKCVCSLSPPPPPMSRCL